MHSTHDAHALQMIEDLASGRRRLTRAGDDVPVRLFPKDRAAFDRACKLGYLVAPANRLRLRDLWCHRADVLRVPDVLATPRGRFARIRCDLLQAGTTVDVQVLERLEFVLGSFRRFLGHSSWFCAERVPIGCVDFVCKLFVRAAAGDELLDLPTPPPPLTEAEARRIEAFTRAMGVRTAAHVLQITRRQALHPRAVLPQASIATRLALRAKLEAPHVIESTGLAS